MNVLCVHNDYTQPSGEGHALESLAGALASGGHHISWLRASSSIIGGSLSLKTKAFFSGIYSVGSRRKMEKILEKTRYDLILVQNLYPFLSPSVFDPCRCRGI